MRARACAPSSRSGSLDSKIANPKVEPPGANPGWAQRLGEAYLVGNGALLRMPFTLAHPAAAIPLRRVLGSYAVLSALVIGSLTPDLSYFVPVRIPRGATHSALALFWFCLPMGFSVYVVFHAFLKRPLVSLLPSYLRRRLVPVADHPGGLPAAPWAGVLVSLLAGATTHIVWDAFTHAGAPAARQVASTALGFLLLAFFSLRWLRSAVPSATDRGFAIPPRLRAGLLTLVLLAWALLALPSAAPLLRHGMTAHALENFFARALIVGSSASAIALMLFAVLWHLAQGDRRSQTPGSALQGR